MRIGLGMSLADVLTVGNKTISYDVTPNIIHAWKLSSALTAAVGATNLTVTEGSVAYSSTNGVDGAYAILADSILQAPAVTMPSLFSLSFWVNPRTAFTTNDTFFTTQEIFCYISGGNILVEYNSDPLGDNGGYTSINAGPIDLDNWNHFGVTLDDSTGQVKVYLNGILAGEDAEWIGPQFTAPGSDFYGFGPTEQDVWLDDIVIWDRILARGEMSQIARGQYHPFT